MRDAAREVIRLLARWRLFGSIGPEVRREWPLVAIAATCLLAGAAVTLARPWPAQVLIDVVIGERPAPPWFALLTTNLSREERAAVAVALLVLAIAAGQALLIAERRAGIELGQRVVLALRCRLYAKLQRLSLAWHARQRTGELAYRVLEEPFAVESVIVEGMLPLVTQALTLLAVAIALLLLEPRLAAIAFAVVPLVIIWTVWFAEGLRGRSHTLAEADAALHGAATEAIAAIGTVKAFGAEAREYARFSRAAAHVKKEQGGVMKAHVTGSIAAQLVATGAAGAALVTASSLALHRQLAVGELVVFAAYLQALFAPTAGIAAAAIAFQRSAGPLDRIVRLLRETSEDREGGRTLTAPRFDIGFEDVSFAYEPQRPVFERLSLRIPPGTCVAVLGPSGSGKSTLLKLLLRFFDPLSGRVTVDGADLAALDASWWRRQVGYAPQEPALFAQSIADNVRYGDPGASPEAVGAALERVGLRPFLDALPLGDQTLVGEHGVRLSAGQRARVGMARAILRDAPVLLFDEPTAHLDPEAEEQMAMLVGELSAGRTTVVVTHRPAVARRASLVVVLESGRVISEGAPSSFGGRLASVHPT